MPQFHETGYGRTFFEHQLPELIKAINRLAGKEQQTKMQIATANLIKVATETTKDIIGFDGAGELDEAIDLARRALKETD
jgi:hypothetical protein